MSKYTAIVHDEMEGEYFICKYEADEPEDRDKIALVTNAYLNRDDTLSLSNDEFLDGDDIEVLCIFVGWNSIAVDNTKIDIVDESEVDITKGVQPMDDDE